MEALSIPDEQLIGRYLAPYADEATRRTKWRVMLEWLRFCIGARVHVLAADRVLIEQWSAAEQKRVSKSTVAGELSTVCGFYRWAYQENLVDRDEGFYVRRPKRGRRSNQQPIGRGQVQALLGCAMAMGSPIDLVAHLLACNGLRLGDVVDARVEDVAQVDGRTVLTLRHRKGDVLDRVTLPAQTVELLPAAVGGREKGRLCQADGRALTPDRVYRWFDALSDAARLPFKARPHMLRASFVTIALDEGVPARDIMAATGHASVEMVAYYDRAYRSLRHNVSDAVAAVVTSREEEDDGRVRG